MLWIKASGIENELSEKEKRIFKAAMSAATKVASNLSCLGEYIQAVADYFPSHGIVSAFEHALPAIRLPRNSEQLKRISESRLGHVSAWSNQFSATEKKYGCYLLKEHPNGELIDNRELSRRLELLRAAGDMSADTLEINKLSNLKF